MGAPRRSSWTRCESAHQSAPCTASCRATSSPPGGELSLHELGLSNLLAALPAVASHPPEVVVIGAQVGSVQAFTEALSAPLQNVLPAAVAMVVRECSPTA
jgi:Ni,Fe-hydrogenase maturation factor